MIELHVEPRVMKTWDAFQAENPPFSIALDGYVDGPPSFSSHGPHANFDHHSLVDRLTTRSTCMQVYMAITMGLFDTFQQDGEPHANLFVNDGDQDTCLAVWVLRNPERCEGIRVHQPIARLLIGEDAIDCTGGAYPVSPDAPFMQEQAWIFQPYVDARTSGALTRVDADTMRSIIEAVGVRITAYVEGRGERIELDTRYDRIGGGDGWEMIVEQGPHARTGLFSEGVRAYVAVRENGDGTWTYTLGKMSPFIRFPVQELYGVLNAEEGLESAASRWGGSNTIGGSPREGGSKLSPQELERIVNRTLAQA
ncbi:MAG: hypothetical protein QNJ90_12415 [Planctomycetota bacterium]|nr:hypothetical protein [Planctomycetota bacterium]